MAKIKRITKPMVELGTTGLKHYGGILDDEFNNDLKGKKGREVFREMADNDPVVGAMLFAVEMLIRQVNWDVDAAGDDQQDLDNAEFLRSCMDDTDRPWTENISERLTKLIYGWEACHPVYKLRRGALAKFPSKYSDGKIGWRKLPTRSQDTIYQWEISEHGEVLGATFQAPPNYNMVSIPADRLILFRTTSRRGSPEGRSCLRNSYKPYYFKSKVEVFEAIGAERDLAGLPKIEAPAEWFSSEADANEKGYLAEIKRIGRNVRMDEQMCVLIPQLWDENGNKQVDFSLLASPGKKQIDTTKVVDRYNNMIAITMLSDFVLLGQQQVGSFALANSKTEIFASALGAWCKSIADTFNEVEVPRLFALNGWDGPTPRIVPGDIEERDLKALGEYVAKISAAGLQLFPSEDGALERYLLRAAKLPEPPEKTTAGPAAKSCGQLHLDGVL